MKKTTDIQVQDATLFFLPVAMRMPLKFGAETITSITCARVRVTVVDAQGRTAQGWGETPLSVAWVWPGTLSFTVREERLKTFCIQLCRDWPDFKTMGHPIEIGQAFIEGPLKERHSALNVEHTDAESMPWLAALVCASAFDIAVHDAYGMLHGVPVYATYNARFMNRDLSAYLMPAEDVDVTFAGLYPEEFFTSPPPTRLPAWHLVGGKDPVEAAELTGHEPCDGYPVLLADWIKRDGLTCLKVKLRGNDAAWDYDRLVKVGTLAMAKGVDWLTTDFNCLVTAPAYVNEILDRLVIEHPRIYGMILYVEQPFPYELEAHRIDVHSVSARKPLFMDESAHDWQLVKLGRSLGWTGVALKTCKTQTGALLALCWAKAHGMTLMVQDLTNPMLAQVPHVLLAAHAGTIMGVETNAMQFYPEASLPEAVVHPGLYRRHGGCLDLTTLNGPGFGYAVERIRRELPPAVCQCAAGD